MKIINKPNKISLILMMALFFWPFLTFAQGGLDIDPEFNPGNIISNEEILDTDSMTLSEIRNFLNKQNGYINNLYTYNAHNTPDKSAAEIIYEAATNSYDCDGVTLSDNPNEDEKRIKCRKTSTVNPKFLLVLLQKEQSLITDTTPKQSQLDWATGYGCPDNWACNPYYKGFGKQVNSAALQFRYYMDHPNSYKYQAGKTYTFSNPYGVATSGPITVTIENAATAGLYNYTPHVFNGNYNFYKLWQKYFPGDEGKSIIVYPDNSLLRATGEKQIWLIKDGKKNPFTSQGALISRFDEKKILDVPGEILEYYATGTPLKYPNYSLIKTPEKKIYLLVDNKKRLIDTEATFKKVGFNKAEIIDGTEADLAIYELGPNLTSTSTYAYGALIQSTKTGGVYYISEDTKAPIIDKILLATKFKNRKIIKKTEAELNKYKKIDPILFDNGELLKSPANPQVYLVNNGVKKWFASGEVFEKLGYRYSNIITVSPQLLALYKNGESITE
jgi:hypothetical protein